MFKWLKQRARRKQRLAALQRRQNEAREKSPLAFAVKSAGYSWVKAVVLGQAGAMSLKEEYSSDKVVGPFRSELDCEDFCDRKNICDLGRFKWYEPIAIPKEEKA